MTRLLPVLALLIPMAVRADDFSSALGEIQEKAKLHFAQVRAPKRAPANPVKPVPLPAAADADWAKIVEKVKKDGKYLPGGFLSPARFMLEDKTGDPKSDHQMRSVVFLGGVNDQGQFEAMGALVVWMDYKLDAATGNFNAEQWMFETDVYGQMTDMGRMTAVMKPDGKPAAPPVPEQLQPGDARIKTQFEAQVKFWAGK